jgi:DnaJ-class molecular chaperone
MTPSQSGRFHRPDACIGPGLALCSACDGTGGSVSIDDRGMWHDVTCDVCGGVGEVVSQDRDRRLDIGLRRDGR